MDERVRLVELRDEDTAVLQQAAALLRHVGFVMKNCEHAPFFYASDVEIITQWCALCREKHTDGFLADFELVGQAEPVYLSGRLDGLSGRVPTRLPL